MSDPIPLLLFAKAPIAGKVKTRLHSHCTPEQAADIAELLLEASLQKACDHWPGQVFVSTWLDHQHPALLRLCDRFGVSILQQKKGDLGQKMYDSFNTYGYPLAIMGTDAPHVSAEALVQMHSHLANQQCAIGPSLDGGYYIIGLSQPQVELFTEIPWGTDQVLSLTCQRAQQAHIQLHQLNALQDIDEWGDLLQAAGELPLIKEYLRQQKLI